MHNGTAVNRAATSLVESDGLQDGFPSKVGVIIVDAQTRILGINPAAGDLLGVDVHEYVDRPLAVLMSYVCQEPSGVKRTLVIIRRALHAGHIWSFELEQANQLHAAFLKVQVSPIYSQAAGNAGAVLTLENITAHKQVGLGRGPQEDARLYAKLFELTAKLEEEKEEYRLRSIHDGLTGLYNYSFFQELLALEVQRAQRYGKFLSVMMMDVDDFRLYNDNYGHPAGDRALAAVAAILRHNSRRIDQMARYSGEEFAAILPETNIEGAYVAGERIRQAVERNSRRSHEIHRPITVSIGIAEYPDDANNPYELLLQAEERLYEAKMSGKNRVCILH
jgi:diguanylate cyclase (GGDEF)-like protein